MRGFTNTVGHITILSAAHQAVHLKTAQPGAIPSEETAARQAERLPTVMGGFILSVEILARQPEVSFISALVEQAVSQEPEAPR